jgi:hypothetical protein
MAIAVSFLFSPSPKTEKDYCGQYIHLGTHAGFTFNCDAADYCMNADSPARMLGDSAVRQSRPLFVLLASAIGHPLQWLTNKLDLPLFRSMGEEAGRYAGFYMGYILLNFLTLLLSLIFFESIAMYITGRSVNKWILLAFQVILVSNEITKAFFWTAHQQFFALLTPLITIWLVLRLTAQKRTQAEIAMLSFMCGLGMLLYGNFLTSFGTIVIVAYLTDRKVHLVHLLKNTTLFLLPTIAWISFCIYHHGHYYNHEVVVFRQLVWMKDALNISVGNFFSALTNNITAYLSSFGEMAFFIVAAIVAAISIGKQLAHPPRALQSFITTGIILAVFFMILGYYEERLTYTLLPVCLCIILLAYNRKRGEEQYPAVYLLAALAWHMYTVLSYGPFS